MRLFNDTGSIELLADIDETLLTGTALSYKGRWPSLEESGHNINVVHTPIKADMGESTTVHGTEVTIEPITD